MQHEIIESVTRVQAWMVSYLGNLLDIPHENVDVTLAFDQYGLDSAATVAFTSDLGHWLETKLDSRLMVDHNSIQAVSNYVGEAFGTAVPA